MEEAVEIDGLEWRLEMAVGEVEPVEGEVRRWADEVRKRVKPRPRESPSGWDRDLGISWW